MCSCIPMSIQNSRSTYDCNKKNDCLSVYLMILLLLFSTQRQPHRQNESFYQYFMQYFLPIGVYVFSTGMIARAIDQRMPEIPPMIIFVFYMVNVNNGSIISLSFGVCFVFFCFLNPSSNLEIYISLQYTNQILKIICFRL